MGLFVMQVWGRGASRYGAEDGCLLRDFGVCVYLDGIYLYMCVWGGTCACGQIGGQGGCCVSRSITLPYSFETGFLTEPRTRLVDPL